MTEKARTVDETRATARSVVYATRQPTGESLRGARGLKQLAGVRLLCVCEQAPRADAAEVFDAVALVADVHDAAQLTAAARALGEKHGPLYQLVTAQETLLEAVALANEALGAARGMGVEVVRRALDKSLLKQTLARAGVGTARDCLITDEEEARRFAAEVGFPLVLKPLGGSGGLATWRVGDAAQLERALALTRPTRERPLLAEVFLRGEELCVDTITINNEPRFHSVCLYRPSIMEALGDERVLWSCVMPRDIGGERYREFIEQGLAAVRALRVGDAMTHMEGFLLAGGGHCFTDATLRPAGARIGPMLAHAYDIDPYFAWARCAVDGCFDGPWERKYAVGTVFLRGMGRGTIEHVGGVEAIKQGVGGMIVEARLPRVGAAKAATYTGDGYVTVRHPETRAVEDALRFVSETFVITYSDPGPPSHADEDGGGRWSEQLQHFTRQLNKPAWEDDSLPRL